MFLSMAVIVLINAHVVLSLANESLFRLASRSILSLSVTESWDAAGRLRSQDFLPHPPTPNYWEEDALTKLSLFPAPPPSFLPTIQWVGDLKSYTLESLTS